MPCNIRPFSDAEAERCSLVLLVLLGACEEASRSTDAKRRHLPESRRRPRGDAPSRRTAADERFSIREALPRRAPENESSSSLTYEAGPLGIADGGALFLQPSPFWGWDSPQTEMEEAPGATNGHDRRPGGASRDHGSRRPSRDSMSVGESSSRASAFTSPISPGPTGTPKRQERVWIAVDGDGDGVRSLVLDSPKVDVVAGEPSRLVLTLPTTARPGEVVRLVVAALDASGKSRGRDDEADRAPCVRRARAARERRSSRRRRTLSRASRLRRGRLTAFAHRPRAGLPPRAIRSSFAMPFPAFSGAISMATRSSPTGREPPRTTSPTPATSPRSTSSP